MPDLAGQDQALEVELSTASPPSDSTATHEMANSKDSRASSTIQRTNPTSADNRSPATVHKWEKKDDFIVKALYDFDAADESELSFRKDDLIFVSGAPYTMWWNGSLDGRTGKIPTNYVKRCD
jgi:hypothetical protein